MVLVVAPQPETEHTLIPCIDRCFVPEAEAVVIELQRKRFFVEMAQPTAPALMELSPLRFGNVADQLFLQQPPLAIERPGKAGELVR